MFVNGLGKVVLVGYKITDTDVETIYDEAIRNFYAAQRGVRGQQITPQDSPHWWIIKQTELFLEQKKESYYLSDWVDDGV